MRYLTVAALGALALSLVGLSSSGTLRSVKIDSDVRRTSFGIPHIKARDWASLGYGLGYSYARDNLCILAREIITAQGREAEFFGPSTGNLRRSFVWGLLSREATLRELFASQPREIQQMIYGYAAGYNRWLAQTGVDNLPAACAGEPWVQPISPLDLAAVGVKGLARASVDPLQRAIFAAEPPPPAELAARKAKGSAPRTVAAAELPKHIDFPEIDSVVNINRNFAGGSNAYGLGRDATENGRGMLLGNPHEPWNGIQRFYQAHLTIPGRFNVMGVTQIALPVVVIGFNDHVAWSHTISTANRFTIYELSLDPDDPLVYLYENEAGVVERRPIEPTTVRIKVLGEDEPREHTFYRSHFGYMLALDVLSGLAPKWGDPFSVFGETQYIAYTMRDVNEDNLRPIQQWWQMDQARSVPDLKAKLEETIGMPFVNTIAADSQGNAFYADIGAVPNVTLEKIGACPGSIIAAVLTLNGIITLDGTRAACEWGNDPGTPQDGIFGRENLPSLIRSDYVTNSNDSYWLSNPDERLEGFSPLLRRDTFNERSPRLLRTRMGLIQVLDRFANRDGLGGTKFDQKKLQTIWYGDRSYSAELELDGVVAACESGDPPKTAWPTSSGDTVDVTEACALLPLWDRTDNLDSPGVLVWREFFRRLGRDVQKYTVPFDENDPINTPNTLRIGARVHNALGDAVQDLTRRGIPLDGTLRDYQFVTSDGEPPLPDGSNKIPMHGGQGQNGVFNVAGAPLTDQGYTPITGGPTYMQSITWDDRGRVIPEAILGFSQSDDPENPHYVDQTRRYSRKEFIRLPFREREIRKDLISRERLRDRIQVGDPSVIAQPSDPGKPGKPGKKKSKSRKKAEKKGKKNKKK